MNFNIRKMKKSDKNEVLKMMKEFYSSEAVLTNGSDEIFNVDFDNCINTSPYLDGYIFENEQDVLGYSMVAKSFSTEFGKPCIWLEDLYLKSKFRGKGIIPKFFDYVKTSYPNSIFKLEVEKENEHAIYVYKKIGFSDVPYIQMKHNF